MLIVSTRGQVAGPEGQTDWVGFTIEKIMIMHIDKALVVIEWICQRLWRIIVDGYCRRALRAQHSAGWVTERYRKCLVALKVHIFVD